MKIYTSKIKTVTPLYYKNKVKGLFQKVKPIKLLFKFIYNQALF